MFKKTKKERNTESIKKQSKFMYSAFLLGLVGILFYGALVLYDTYSREDSINVQINKQDDVGQGDKLILQFSTAVDGRFDLSRVDIEPKLEVVPFWNNNKELIFSVKEQPEVNQAYTIKINNIKTFWLGFRKNLVANFQAVKTPAVVNVYPSNKQTDVSYDTKIKIDLDESLSEKLFLEIDINPDIEVEATLSENRTSVEIISKNPLEKATKYDIVINAKLVDESGEKSLTEKFSKNLYKGCFTTKVPPRVIYSFNKDGSPRATEDLTWEIPAKISQGRYIDIDLTHQVMSIFEDGLRKDSYKVSTGKRSMKTPTGTFKVFSKVPRPWSAKYGLYMPYYLGFTYQGHGIHELPEWPSGYKEGANHLGIPVSHGCVRLGVGPAKIVYDFASKGTPVVVHY